MRRYIAQEARQQRNEPIHPIWPLRFSTPSSLLMPDTLKLLRALADSTRLRIIALLEGAELSVQELQEITRLGQSRISTHLGLLQEAGVLESRREGKRTFYKLCGEPEGVARDAVQLAIRGASE